MSLRPYPRVYVFTPLNQARTRDGVGWNRRGVCRENAPSVTRYHQSRQLIEFYRFVSPYHRMVSLRLISILLGGALGKLDGLLIPVE